MLIVDGLSFAYESVKALQDISLSVNKGEILCLLGPSGCGKTTLLRVIAGLETGYHGHLSIMGQDMRDIPVNQRAIGLMFQDFALFPHMNVEQNIAYGLKRKGQSTAESQAQVRTMIQRVGLSGFEKRDVNLLSGGQKQRVALARSLAPNPRLLMLDEPLGSLDALLRDQLIVELRDIIKSVGLTSIYVTHDQKEAYAIADRIAVMNNGVIEQVDTPQALYYRPQTEFIARFLGLSNIFQLGTHPMIDDLVSASPHDFSSATAMLIHPSGIYTDRPDDQPCVELVGQVMQVIFRGESYQVMIKLADNLIIQMVMHQSNLQVGDTVAIFAQVDSLLPL